MPIDKTALLLAGVQSISMWMIPVVLAGVQTNLAWIVPFVLSVAGIGVGIYLVKRRF